MKLPPSSRRRPVYGTTDGKDARAGAPEVEPWAVFDPPPVPRDARWAHDIRGGTFGRHSVRLPDWVTRG